MRIHHFTKLILSSVLLLSGSAAWALEPGVQQVLMPLDELIPPSDVISTQGFSIECAAEAVESGVEAAENEAEELAEETREIAEGAAEVAEDAREVAEDAREIALLHETIFGVTEEVREVTVAVPNRFEEVIEQTDELPRRFNGLRSDLSNLSTDIGQVAGTVADGAETEASAAASTAVDALEDELVAAIAAAEGMGSDLEPMLDAFVDIANGVAFEITNPSIQDDPLIRSAVTTLSEGAQEFVDFYFAAGGDYELIGDILEGCPPTMGTDALEDLFEQFETFLVEEVGIPQDVLDDLNLLPPDQYASKEMSFYVKLRFKWYFDLLDRGMGKLDYPHPVVTVLKEITTLSTVLLDRLVLCIDSAASQASSASRAAYRSSVESSLVARIDDLDDGTRFTSDAEWGAVSSAIEGELGNFGDALDASEVHADAEIDGLDTSWEESLAVQEKQELVLAIQAQLGLTGFETLYGGSEIPTLGNLAFRASPSNHVYALPEALGGHAEVVDEVVNEAVQTYLALGIGVNDAVNLLARARDERDAGEYRRAFLTYSLAYLDAVNVSRL
ncbi:MAG: hypothetical protein AAF533_19865 [Acidobacteriota bacterium]